MLNLFYSSLCKPLLPTLPETSILRKTRLNRLLQVRAHLCFRQNRKDACCPLANHTCGSCHKVISSQGAATHPLGHTQLPGDTHLPLDILTSSWTYPPPTGRTHPLDIPIGHTNSWTIHTPVTSIPTPCGQIDTCKHITFPPTSLAGGNERLQLISSLRNDWYLNLFSN